MFKAVWSNQDSKNKERGIKRRKRIKREEKGVRSFALKRNGF